MRTLLTLLTVGLFSGTAMAAADVHEKLTRWRAVMVIAYVLQTGGVVLALAMTWGLLEALDQLELVLRLLVKALGLLITWSVVLPLAGQIAALRLKGHPALLRPAGCAMALLLAGMISLAIVFEIDHEYYYRLLAVVGIVAAAAGVVARIMQRIQGLDKAASVESVRLAMEVKCPRCLLVQTLPDGASRCARCRLGITVHIEEPRCPACNYLLYKLTTPTCPECGHALAPEETAVPV